VTLLTAAFRCDELVNMEVAAGDRLVSRRMGRLDGPCKVTAEAL
jgi:hypothetical protein